MLNHLRQRVTETLASAQCVTLATYGPAEIQAGAFPCEANELRLYLLVPRTSDHLFNIESDPAVVVTTDHWQLRGTARILTERLPLALLHRSEAEWCAVVEISSARLTINPVDGAGHSETIDIG